MGLIIGPALIFCANAQPDDFDDWYQVEIVVFKPRNQPDSTEVWPLETLSYPQNLVAIEPAFLAPYSLSQLQQLDDQGTATERPDSRTSETTFLFADRASTQQNRATVTGIAQTSPEGLESADEPSAEIDMIRLDVLLNSGLPEAFRELPDTEFTLGSVARSLRRSSRYDLLMHRAWLQPLDQVPTPVLVQAGERYDDQYEIDGTLNFSRSRFLHVEAELWYTMFESRFNQNQLLQPGQIRQEWLKDYPGLVKAEQTKNTHIAVHSHLLRHSRRMRSEEMHFIDHPYFGIIVQIQGYRYDGATDAN